MANAGTPRCNAGLCPAGRSCARCFRERVPSAGRTHSERPEGSKLRSNVDPRRAGGEESIHEFGRRGRDSNPRQAFDLRPLSKRVPSATRSPLPKGRASERTRNAEPDKGCGRASVARMARVPNGDALGSHRPVRPWTRRPRRSRAAPPPMRPRPPHLLLTLVVAYGGLYLCRANVDAAFPVLARTFGYSKTELGLLSSLSIGVYAAGKVVLGTAGE